MEGAGRRLDPAVRDAQCRWRVGAGRAARGLTWGSAGCCGGAGARGRVRFGVRRAAAKGGGRGGAGDAQGGGGAGRVGQRLGRGAAQGRAGPRARGGGGRGAAPPGRGRPRIMWCGGRKCRLFSFLRAPGSGRGARLRDPPGGGAGRERR